MIRRAEISRKAAALGLPEQTIEHDYMFDLRAWNKSWSKIGCCVLKPNGKADLAIR